MSTLDEKESLILTQNVFQVLLNKMITAFKLKYRIDKIKDYQLYGFDNYKPKEPSLKSDIETELKCYVNGKYLYNKYRELQQGKPFIKLSREYKTLYFNYLGYDTVTQFIQNEISDAKLKTEALSLYQLSPKITDFYYVCYYYGETGKLNKGLVTFKNTWKSVEMKYIYLADNQEKTVYVFHGSVTISENFMFLDTKFFNGHKNVEGAKFIFFIGKTSHYERNILVGTYSGFDKYDSAIAGKMILRKYNTLAEADAESNTLDYDPIIALEINRKRFEVDSIIRNDLEHLSPESPYAFILEKIPGKYQFIFEENNILNIEISALNYALKSLNKQVIIDRDELQLFGKGKLLYLHFDISGVFFLQKISIYISLLDFLRSHQLTLATYSGVNSNNEAVHGTLEIQLFNS